jgi:hypothetical protein
MIEPTAGIPPPGMFQWTTHNSGRSRSAAAAASGAVAASPQTTKPLRSTSARMPARVAW